MDRDTMVFPGASLKGVAAPLKLTDPPRYYAAARMDMPGDDTNDGWFVHPDYVDCPSKLAGLFRICEWLHQDAAIIAVTPAVEHRSRPGVWCDAVVVAVVVDGWRRFAKTPGECTTTGRAGLRLELIACIEAESPRPDRRQTPSADQPAPAELAARPDPGLADRHYTGVTIDPNAPTPPETPWSAPDADPRD